jgi:predicted DNA-binding protein with PD1-like motif
MSISKDVAEQIEAAYDFRGHITLTLNDGAVVEGFLFNREVTPLTGEPYVEVLRKDSDERLRFAAKDVKSVSLTGKDFAVPFVPPKKD